MSEMIDMVTSDAEQRMQKSVAALKAGFIKIRTGRAQPSLLDHVTVPYYGADTPLNQLANISVQDARTLSIIPFDKTSTASIEKAIINSDLGLNPTNVGANILIPLPPMTEERRKDLVKVVKGEAEAARVAVRNIRRDANHDLKGMVKDKEISEDEERKAEDIVQKLTNKYIAKVDEVLAEKEKELMEI